MEQVTALLSELSNQLANEIKVQKGVRNQIESLEKELKCAEGYLRDVSKVPPDRLSEQARIYNREVTEAAYDIEDIVQDFYLRVDVPRQPTGKKSLLSRLKDTIGKLRNSKERHNIAGAVEEIKKQLQEADARRRRFELDLKMPAAPPKDRRNDCGYYDGQLFGIDKSRDDLISKLPSKGDKKKMKIVCVFGPGGLGKTTSVKAVYEKQKSEYDCAAFVTVGQCPNYEKTFKDIFFDLDRKKHAYIGESRKSEDVLIDILQKFLEGKRYLIVIDDIWELEHLMKIKSALVESNTGSAIITTSRNSEATEGTGAHVDCM